MPFAKPPRVSGPHLLPILEQHQILLPPSRQDRLGPPRAISLLKIHARLRQLEVEADAEGDGRLVGDGQATQSDGSGLRVQVKQALSTTIWILSCCTSAVR
jgi:hypothetical protein